MVANDDMRQATDRIVFGSPREAFAIPEEALPAFSLPTKKGGEVSADSDFQVFFCDHVLDSLWKHARTSPDLECAGLLLGHPFVQPGAFGRAGHDIHFLVVAQTIPYDTPEQHAGHVVVSAQALAEADAKARKELPGLRPVGWYHTHPGHGIFLSGHDKIITHSIFNASWQIAAVLDPQQNQFGLFRGPEGQRLAGYRELRGVPIEFALMQQYHKARAMLETKQLREALDDFRAVQARFEKNRAEMTFWRDSDTYRDVAKQIQDLEAALGVTAAAETTLDVAPSGVADADTQTAHQGTTANDVSIVEGDPAGEPVEPHETETSTRPEAPNEPASGSRPESREAAGIPEEPVAEPPAAAGAAEERQPSTRGPEEGIPEQPLENPEERAVSPNGSPPNAPQRPQIDPVRSQSGQTVREPTPPQRGRSHPVQSLGGRAFDRLGDAFRSVFGKR